MHNVLNARLRVNAQHFSLHGAEEIEFHTKSPELRQHSVQSEYNSGDYNGSAGQNQYKSGTPSVSEMYLLYYMLD